MDEGSKFMILGIDLGTKCGWALMAGRELHKSGVWDLTPKRGDSPGMRIIAMRSHVGTITSGVRLVVYERPHLRGGHAASVLSHLEGELLAHCYLIGVEHTAVHSATLKKFATGSGRADKAAMIVAAKRINPNVEDDNEADAIMLAAYGAGLLGKQL